MLLSYVCKQLHKEMIILLGCSPLPIICSGILELNAFEGRLDLRGVRVLIEARGVVHIAATTAGVAVEAVSGGWPWSESNACRALLGPFVTLRSVLYEFD
jgi:hypothetical protein